MKWFVLLGLVLSSSAFVKRDVGTNLFAPGKEYVYDFAIDSHAGSSDYVAFSSVFNITGELHVQNTGNVLNVKLNDIKFGAYNGEFDLVHAPVIALKAYDQLKPLAEPFSVKVSGGKAQGIVLNTNVDEWAHNIKRGIATALQLDLSKIEISKADNFVTEEHTVVGDCETDYIVIPAIEDNRAQVTKAQVRKYRSHARCNDQPRRIRKPAVHLQYCPDENSRDVLNSTGFGVYDLEIESGSLVAKKIKVGSTVIYNIFGVAGHTQHSYSGLTLTLKNVGSGSVAAPSNAKSFEDLKFAFENDINEDEDIKSPKPFFFHHKDADLDAAGQNKAEDQLIANIKKLHQSLESVEVFENTKDFHKVSPFSLIPFVSAMDYDHLKEVLGKLKGGDETEYKIFLDTLVIAGTGPATLVIRDIVSETQNTLIVGRLVGPLPNYIRNPTENLLKELEPLIKPDNTKANARIIEFAFASLLGRTCKKNGCQKSGLLTKWVKIWSDKIDAGQTFDEKTSAVIALRNINLPQAAKKLLTVVESRTADRTIRVAALNGIKSLLKTDKQARTDLKNIFFDRHEDSELRNNALQLLLLVAPEEKVFSEVAIYTWTEKDKEVKNFVKTLFKGLAGTTRPCLLHVGSWAKNALQMAVTWETSGKYSGVYVSDYHDPQYNFGHMTHVSVQKNGHSMLPKTVYISFNGQIAGYGTNYLSLFLRIEGLGKSLASRIMSMTTGVVDFENIQAIFQKIGVQERQADPLRVEIAVLLHNRVVAYHAADQKTITTIPQLIKKVTEMKSAAYDKELIRMMLIGGITTEQSNEIGIPVSTVSAVTSVAAVHAKVSSEKAGTTVSRNYDVRVQLNIHGISAVNNHLSAFGTAHSVEAVRSLRIRVPRKISIGLDIKQQSLNFVLTVPTKEDPILAQVHATAFTAVQSDAPASLKDQETIDLLHETCPDCKGLAVISKGEKFREERKLGSGYKYKSMEGISAGAKYYDCEKIHSRIHVLRSLRKFFGPENKNLGGRVGRPLTLLRLGARYAFQSLFLSPPTETCGLKAWYKQDETAQSVFEKIEGQAKLKYETDPKEKIGMKAQVKSSLNFKYGGATPKTKTLDLALSLAKVGVEKVELKTKLAARDESAGRSGVVCIDLTSQTNKVADFFDYEGVNEPTYERTINIAWGKEDKGAKEGCPTGAGIKINKKAHRSQAQKDEAKSDRWPYKQCREQKNSPKYPGALTPATEPCLWAAFKQTNLREANITIDYKVDPEARKRWRYPGALAAAILLPYHVPAEEVDGHAGHGDHGPTPDGFIQGTIEMDVTMDEENPEADIHFHSSQGEQEHFHGVDLNFLPGPLKRPVYSRFSQLQYAVMALGVYGYCDVTPHAIQTFDNRTYFADLSECETLISGDCAEKPRYVVLGKKISNDKLGVKVVVGEHTVEFNDLNNAVIDGKSVALTDKIVTAEGDDTKIFKIWKHDDNNVFLISKSLSLFVRYTGHYTTVTVGSRFRATNCGLCGNFDGCGRNDLTGPDASCKNIAPADMTKAYIVRDGNCAGVGSSCPSS